MGSACRRFMPRWLRVSNACGAQRKPSQSLLCCSPSVPSMSHKGAQQQDTSQVSKQDS